MKASLSFKELAPPFLFFAGGLATAASAPNTLVMAGGLGLAAAASTAAIAVATGRNLWRVVPSFALAANIPLTINGMYMISDGLAGGNTALAAAGALLAGANSIAYGFANACGVLGTISPHLHARFSQAAGSAIALAGGVLQDPTLGTIGLAFAAEASMRAEATRPQPVLQASQTKSALKL